MTDDFASLYAYNRWADRRVLDACRMLGDDRYAAEPEPGWSSVRASLAHIAIATEGWLRGLTGVPVEDVPTEADLPTADAAARLLDRAHGHFESLRPRLTAEWLSAPLTLSRRGRTVTLPPWAVLRHVVNHATYHRGQVASKLRRLGVEPPATDFIAWVFEQGPPAA